ncbi:MULTISPECIES: diguanylate cyclase [unclassified Chelatococcus]|uniref:GGDEF domain-containing protein n=1 Tax=unclassified Chelatococcus TaxID=2638111 RepID=UPI001BD18511|nr:MULTISPECIES: diguanylate cyclase [unclassified Chelatococcus]MBS7700576.1 diguanylate cyclase [Chelatococcus sp. YT9]MBX3558691.1 diguanylate cyclase [Chelatococcus sp.]
MTTRPTILIVDDEISNIEIINATLEDDYEISFALSGEQALEAARLILPDLILLDVLMPGMDGFEVCSRLKADSLLADVPVIFTTGLGDTDHEVRGLELGAIDYVTKPIHPVILRARVGNHVELKRMRDQLAEMALTDALTGLSNRRRIENSLAGEIARLAGSGDWLSVVMLDIDFFKEFNDTYGHLEGDRCIAMIASALRRALKRANDLPARYGGEEFACVLPGADAETASAVAEDIRSRIASLDIPHESSLVSPFVTVSVGVATARCEKGMSPDLWIAIADGQLYLSKADGRNRISHTTFKPPSSSTDPREPR